MPTADELYQEANCFLCYGITQTQALKIALMRRQVLELDPNADVSPEALLASAACYNCYANGSVGDLFELALLAIIAATPCTPGNVDGLIWGPNPETVAQFDGSGNAYLSLINTSTGEAYTTLSFGNPTHVVGDMTWTGFNGDGLTFRLLETVGGGLNANGGGVSSITSFVFESLVSVGTDADLGDHPALVTLNLDQLVSVGGFLYVSNNGVQTTLSLPALTSVDSIQIESSAPILSAPVLPTYPPTGITADASLLTLNLPAVTDDGAGQLWVDLGTMSGLLTLNLNSVTNTTAATNLELNNCPNLTSVNLDSMATVNGTFNTNSNSLTSLSLPSLVTVTADFLAFSSLLISFSAPLWVPTDGTTIDFNNCALNIPSVELILRRCVVAGVLACTIDLSGGTNAGTASLSAQGQADVATLGAQVTMNP